MSSGSARQVSLHTPAGAGETPSEAARQALSYTWPSQPQIGFSVAGQLSGTSSQVPAKSKLPQEADSGKRQYWQSGHGATPAQVLLSWALLRGTSVIPKSVSPKRLAENLAAAELELTTDDMERIAGLDRHRRYIDGTFWTLEGGPYTVEEFWGE